MIQVQNLETALGKFRHEKPFDHCVVDDFFEHETAIELEKEFLEFESNKWYYYHNPIEEKKHSMIGMLFLH